MYLPTQILKVDIKSKIDDACFAWACWDKMSEQEKKETWNEYFEIAEFGMNLGMTLQKIASDEKIKQLEAIDNALEVRLLEAFAHALHVEDATGWTTGIAIRDFLFRNGKWN